MQQDWKKIWDNLNPDDATKERMKQAILQKMQTPSSCQPPERIPLLQRLLRFGTVTRAAALCSVAAIVAVTGLQMAEKIPQQQQAFLPETETTEPTTTEPSETDKPQETGQITMTTVAASPPQTTTECNETTVLTSSEKTTVTQTTSGVLAASVDEPTEEPEQTEPESPVETEPVVEPVEPVYTTESVVTQPITTETTAVETEPVETTTFSGFPTYGSFYDFSYARWNGIRYQTNYETISYDALDPLAGFSVAIQTQNSLEQVYTIAVYPVKGYSIQECIAVQYAGDENYFYFYAIT